YAAVVLLGWGLKKRRYIFALAAVCTVLVAVGYAYSPPGGVPWVVAVNRFLALFAIWIVAALLFVIRKEERARAESELRFRDLAETASDWFWEMGPDFRFTYVSEKFFEITKWKHEEIIGKTRQETADPLSQEEDPDAWRRHREDLEARRPFSNFVRSFPGRSGTPYEGKRIYVRLNGRPRFDEKGEFLGYRGTATDITREIEAEEALRENEERLRLILENAVTGIITIDEKGVIQTFNPAAGSLFGYKAEDVIGKNVSMLMPEPDHSKHDGYLGKYLKTGKAKIIGIGREVEGLRKDGSVFPMELGISELVQGGKRTFTGFIEDISERKQAEAALKESEKRFRDLAESAADWFWEMDSNLRFSYMSDRYYEVTGRKPKDIIGKTRLETADAKTLEAEGDARRLHQEVLELRKPFGNFVQSSQGLPGGRYEGRRYYLRLNGRPRFDENGEFLGYRGTATDITREIEAENELLEARDKLEERVAERTRELSEEVEERKRMEIDLRQAKEAAELSDRAKSEFLANMSHELRTPLNSIIGFSDMLHSQVLGTVGNPKYLEYLNDINASGRHLLDLIRDILDVSKIEAGVLDLVDEPVNLRTVVDSSIIMVSERALRAGVAVYTDIPDDLPWLKGDKLRIKQILLNLLGNAVKFTPANGEVTVSAGLRNGGGIFLAVEDTGVGISEKDLERVTEPFAQAASSMTRGHEGTGLGLALAKSLVELHGGSLLIESRTGEGTQVTVRFPKERTLTAH
ncbi:MAG: PAS domain S-box protein, partial [Proteobacteria bacterium]|nr:PAS domain S-box protein [Pseudomonadota bacterium]